MPDARTLREERGFTLPEMLATLVILGVLVTIAVIVLLGILEQRRVDAAALQLASDMRLAHTRATNQLTDWRVIYSADSADYEVVRLENPCGPGCTSPVVEPAQNKSLPSRTKIKSATNIDPGGDGKGMVELNSDGTGRAFYGVSTTIVVSSEDGEPTREIQFTAATSRVEIE